jgi:hypothetical protein
MMISKQHIQIAKHQAAEARRHADEMRARIERLRGSGADTRMAESQLETMLPLVARFEAHIEAMQAEAPRPSTEG